MMYSDDYSLYRYTTIRRFFTRNRAGIDHSNFRQQSVVDEFYQDSTVSVATGDKLVFYQDPIYLLFNQERLNSTLGIDSAKQFIDSLNQVTLDSLSQLRAECTDEDLLATIKDRRLQKPCEVMAWARYCEHNMDKFRNQVSDAVAKQEAEKAKQSSTNNEGAQ